MKKRITFSNLKTLLFESSIASQKFAYHCTNTNPEIIKLEGFKIGKNGYTEENMFKDLYRKYLPRVPVFITNDGSELWDSKAKYIIKLDISGLDLYPDFGRFPEFGAYYDYDDECFYWEDIRDIQDNNKLKQYIKTNYPDLILPASEFTGIDSMKYFGSACIKGGKYLRTRIVDIVEN